MEATLCMEQTITTIARMSHRIELLYSWDLIMDQLLELVKGDTAMEIMEHIITSIPCSRIKAQMTGTVIPGTK